MSDDRPIEQNLIYPDIEKAPENPRPLTSEEILKLSILSVEDERSEAVDSLLAEQRAVYQDTSKAELIETLIERDRQLALTGRQIATGRTGAKLLREFVRGVLNMADHAALRRVDDATKAGKIEGILEALGAEPADLRTLRMSGTTLGTGEDMAQVAEELASGQRKVGTTASKGIEILGPDAAGSDRG